MAIRTYEIDADNLREEHIAQAKFEYKVQAFIGLTVFTLMFLSLFAAIIYAIAEGF